MSRFYVDPENIKGDTIRVSGSEAHHILDVMRLKTGDEVTTFDGLGNEYTGEITETAKLSLTISVKESRKQSPSNVKIALVQAVPKSEKMYFIIQKCTELGVSRIIPMMTERTVVRI